MSLTQKTIAREGYQPLSIDQVHDLARDLLPTKNQPYHQIVTESTEQRRKVELLRTILKDAHPSDLATVLEWLSLPERQLVWALIEVRAKGSVLIEVNDPVRDTLIAHTEHSQLVLAARNLDSDELAELAHNLPTSVVYDILDSRDEATRTQVAAAMSFAPGSVGSLMDFALVSVREDVTCAVVLRYLRHFTVLPDHTDKVFVVDESQRLQGVLPLRTLLVSAKKAQVADIMTRTVVSFRPEEDAEVAASAFERYDLVTAPVVDINYKLIGRLTIDEMLDVIREESETEFHNMTGMQDEEDLFAPIIKSFKNRWMWLAINLATAFIASRVIGLFEHAIQQIVALAALMPIVAGIGGNTGNQTITLIVRAMAVERLSRKQAWRLLRKELSVALLNGLIWGTVMGAVAWLLYNNLAIGGVMAVAMTLNLLLAALMGVMIPMVMQKLGRDPALGSSVMITACTDSGGFFIFLGLATMFLL